MISLGESWYSKFLVGIWQIPGIPGRFLALPPGVPIVLADSLQIPGRFLADSWQIPGRLLVARNSWSILAFMGK